MVSLIVGEKGKGKTKFLLDGANEAAATADGKIVYIDKSNKHMFELDKKVRLVDVSRYPLLSGDGFIGFICGIASQNYDIEKIYLDGFLKCTKVADDAEQIKTYIQQVAAISELTNVDFIISISKAKEDLSPELYDMITVSL